MPELSKADSIVGQILAEDRDPTKEEKAELNQAVGKLAAVDANSARRAGAALQWEYDLGDAEQTVVKLKDSKDEKDKKLNRIWRIAYGKSRFIPGEIQTANALLDELMMQHIADLVRIRLTEVTGKAGAAKAMRLAIKKEASTEREPMWLLGALMGLGLCAGLAAILWYLAFWLPKNPWRTPDLSLDAADALGEAATVNILITFVLGGIVAAVGGQWLEALDSNLGLVAQLVFMVIAYGLGFAYLVVLSRKWQFPLEAIGWTLRDWKTNVLWGIGGCLAAYLIVGVAAYVGALLFSGLPQATNPIGDASMAATGVSQWLVIFLLGSVAAPFGEELFFRGAVFMGLWRRLGRFLPASLISSLCFALVHPQLFAGLLPVMSVGIVSCVLLRERRSLVACMVMHGTFNGSIFLVTMVAR